MKIFCNHEWEILSDTTTESKFEHARRICDNTGAVSVKIPHQMCQADRKNIQILSCSKCGKLKRYVTNI